MDPSLIHARVMLNLDAETNRELEIGCAGGTWTVLRWPAPTEPTPEGRVSRMSPYRPARRPLRDRHCQEPSQCAQRHRLANSEARKNVPFRLCGLGGGDAFNAIPIRTHSTIAFPPTNAPVLDEALAVAHAFASRFSSPTPAFPFQAATSIRTESSAGARKAGTGFLIYSPRSLQDGRDGVASSDIVETSNNLGIVATRDGLVEVHCLSRS